MIHELGVELRSKLSDRGCPVAVIDGPEATGTATFGRERIVIEESGNDDYVPPFSQQRNPVRKMVCHIAAKATIYAQSTKAGALDFEHRRRARLILDQVLVALSEIKSARKGKGCFIPEGGRFIVPADLENSERRGGAVYELEFKFERAVEERTWAGDAKPETTISFIEMTGNPDLTFAEVDATGDTITRSAGSWLDDGFLEGMTIMVSGSTSNNITGVIVELTDTVITLDDTDLADEGPVSNCRVFAGGIGGTRRVAMQGSDTFESF